MKQSSIARVRFVKVRRESHYVVLTARQQQQQQQQLLAEDMLCPRRLVAKPILRVC